MKFSTILFVPMLYSAPMVKALLNGTKSETRRTQGLEKVNESPNSFVFKQFSDLFYFKDKFTGKTICIKSKAKIGDIIWCRETYSHGSIENGKNTGLIFKADNINLPVKWKPSLFMPKTACRLFLEVVSVSVERLQDIDEQSAIKEGIENLSADEFKCNLFKNYLRGDKELDYQDFTTDNPILSYQTLWQKINGKDSWDLNPFVFVYSFKVVECPYGFR